MPGKPFLGFERGHDFTHAGLGEAEFVGGGGKAFALHKLGEALQAFEIRHGYSDSA